MLCFTFCAATLSCYDSKGVGHTASVALQSETDQPIHTILLGLLQRTEYDWEHSYLSLSTRDYSALKSWSDGIQYGGQAQCNAILPHGPEKHTAQRKNQPAKA